MSSPLLSSENLEWQERAREVSRQQFVMIAVLGGEHLFEQCVSGRRACGVGAKLPAILHQTRYWRGAQLRWPASLIFDSPGDRAEAFLRHYWNGTGDECVIEMETDLAAE